MDVGEEFARIVADIPELSESPWAKLERLEFAGEVAWVMPGTLQALTDELATRLLDQEMPIADVVAVLDVHPFPVQMKAVFWARRWLGLEVLPGLSLESEAAWLELRLRDLEREAKKRSEARSAM